MKKRQRRVPMQKREKPNLTPQLASILKPISSKERKVLEQKAQQEGLTSGYYEAHQLAQICGAAVDVERTYQHDRLEHIIMPMIAFWKGIEDLIATIDWVAAFYRDDELLNELPTDSIGELSKLFGELTSLSDLLNMTSHAAYLDIKERVQKRIHGLQEARKGDNGECLRQMAQEDNRADQRAVRAAAYRDLLSTARKPKGPTAITQVIGSRTVELLKGGRTWAQVADMLIQEWKNAPRTSVQYKAFCEISTREGTARRNYVRQTHRNYVNGM